VNTIKKSLNWDAHYVGIKAMKELQQNSITLDELVKEVLPLLSPYVPITIEAQVPVFMEWAGALLKNTTPSRKNNSWYRPKN
jgi:hypothetical protein